MDISGIMDVVLKEYTLSKGLLFENHLYGCVSLLESRIDTSACVLDCSLNTIGVHHGFLKDARALYTGSNAYQSLWLTLLQPQELLVDTFVDEFEDAVFSAMRDVSSVFFAAALDTGELPEELLAEAEAALTVKRRRLRRTLTKQAITPIHKHKGLSKTRKAIRT
jgi:hypothetical protein